MQRLILFTFLWLALPKGFAADWPQILGPERDGVYPGDDVTPILPKEGPRKLWQIKIGEGFAGPSVAGGRLMLFHRIDNQETLEALDATTGQRLWKFAYPATYRDDFGFDAGPRAVPTIAGDRVFIFGAQGMLTCAATESGKKIWQVDAQKEFGASKGWFGFACSPLVEKERVLVNIGGSGGAGIVAFDAATGAVRWKCSPDEASYSSPVAKTIHGQRYGIFFTREGLVGVKPESGEIAFTRSWRPRIAASVNAATPLVIDDLIFLSTSYDTGALLLQVSPKGELKELWSNDDALSNHYATSVQAGGFLYGFDGRQEQKPAFACVELKTGKVQWRVDRFGAGTVTLAGGHLFIVSETGELITAAADSKKFEVRSRAQIMPGGVRAYPALAGGRLYVRSKDQLGCFDLSSSRP